VLRKLLRRGAFGANHYRVETVLHMGWKSHERGEVKTAVEELLRERFLIYHNESKRAIQLNDERLDEIYSIIGDKHD